MTETHQLIQGEFSRKLDDRFRLTLPQEFEKLFSPENGKCVIAKERPGCLSLWDEMAWTKHDKRIDLVQSKLGAGVLELKMPQLQMFGRLLSTRQRELQLAGRARLVVPEGFREFLGVEPGSDVMVVGAAICIELWHPKKWFEYIEGEISGFGALLDTLSQ